MIKGKRNDSLEIHDTHTAHKQWEKLSPMLDRSECQKPASRMTFRGIRSSKFRHVYGSPAKRQKCYDNVKISKSTTDSNLCAVNPKFLAVVIEVGGGGSFIVVPINETGRVGHHVSKVYFCSLKYLISDFYLNHFCSTLKLTAIFI